MASHLRIFPQNSFPKSRRVSSKQERFGPGAITQLGRLTQLAFGAQPVIAVPDTEIVLVPLPMNVSMLDDLDLP